MFSRQSADAKAALEAAQKSVAGNVVVNPYLFEVRDEEGGITPLKERELIRAAGPTMRGDLGKQAEGLTPEQVRRASAARDAERRKKPTRQRTTMSQYEAQHSASPGR